MVECGLYNEEIININEKFEYEKTQVLWLLIRRKLAYNGGPLYLLRSKLYEIVQILNKLLDLINTKIKL